MSLRAPINAPPLYLRRAFKRTSALVGVASLLAAPARAEVPAAPDARGREFRVDFSARHLEVDAELGELLLTGDVRVTVGRYRLGGQRVRLQRGPRGIGVEGGGDIAFCSCDDPPITLGYRSVTIAPPSDVLVERAVLRAGGVPVFWLPYLWLRSPDRLALMFPSVEWRGDDGLLLGSGIHIPFDSNQGRPASRALDLSGAAYIEGGARVDATLFTPQSTTFVRWDHLGSSALTIDGHAAASGETSAIWAYDVDASRGARGRTALSSLEAAARRYDHARLGAGSAGDVLFGAGVAADGVRGEWLSDPLGVGPFAVVSVGGALGNSSSYSFDGGAASSFLAGAPRRDNGETRSLERGVVESSQLLGVALARFALFEQGEMTSLPSQVASSFRVGAGASLGLPLVRHFGQFSHSLEPEAAVRVERRYWDEQGETQLLATGALGSGFSFGRRGAALWSRLEAGVAGTSEALEPIVVVNASRDERLLGYHISAQGEPRTHHAEGLARLRLGPRGGTFLMGYAEARTEGEPRHARLSSPGVILPRFFELGLLDREGLSVGSDLNLALGPALAIGGGVDADPIDDLLLGGRGFVRYRHPCGCFAVAGLGSARRGRGGFDAGVSLDLMP